MEGKTFGKYFLASKQRLSVTNQLNLRFIYSVLHTEITDVIKRTQQLLAQISVLVDGAVAGTKYEDRLNVYYALALCTVCKGCITVNHLLCKTVTKSQLCCFNYTCYIA